MTITQTWIGYARSGKEFEVRDAIRGLGITCEVPRVVEVKRLPKQRFPEAVSKPWMPRLVVMEATAEQWHQAVTVKDLGRSMISVERKEYERFLRPFIDALEGEYSRVMDQVEEEKQSIGRVQEYQIGDKFEILLGPWAGKIATFLGVVEAGEKGPIPMLRGKLDIEIMGKPVPVEVDPIFAQKRIAGTG